MTHNVGVAYRRWLPLCWMVPEAGVAPTGPVPCGDYLAIIVRSVEIKKKKNTFHLCSVR